MRIDKQSDHHIHTVFSDGAAQIDEMVSVAIDKGLKAITINPARWAGLEDRIGSIEEGKDADLVLFDGDPFDVFTKVQMVFIDGELVFDASASGGEGGS